MSVAMLVLLRRYSFASFNASCWLMIIALVGDLTLWGLACG